VNRLDAETGAAGAITITETDGVTLVKVRSFDGPISVTAGEIFAVLVQSLIDSDENDISLTTTSGVIEAGWIIAGAAGDVTLMSAGAIVDGPEDRRDIRSSELRDRGGFDRQTFFAHHALTVTESDGSS
jgi:hypothetical protein